MLELPLGVTNGFFGSLTGTAVAHYQKNVGLSPVGIFGPLTRAKINADVTNTTALPNTGREETATSQAPVDSPATKIDNFIQSVKSLFSTPLDGLITLLFISAILFVSFKIIK